GAPLRVLRHLGPLGAAVPEILVCPDENHRVEHAAFLGPAANQPGVARDDVQAALLVQLEKLPGLARLNLVRAHLENHDLSSMDETRAKQPIAKMLLYYSS